LRQNDVAQLLREKAAQYNHPDFIASDPIQIPRAFSKKEDIEIAGFLAAVIAWGQRVTIINNAQRLMDFMGHEPHRFVTSFSDHDLKPFGKFVHRTFNGDDAITFMHALRRVYCELGGLEALLQTSFAGDQQLPGSGWHRFKETFFDLPHLPRSRKHLPDPMKGSAAKRMNMYLRWMVRRDLKGVDFGIWQSMQPSQLYVPLDVHTSRVARKLGLLTRKQDDWKAVVELTGALRKIEPEDPVKLDFALFGMGVFEKF
jgi:uncharacterized protein (TIGR02757 family)